MLATEQHGVVAVWQLQRLGFSKQRIARWVAAGRLHRLHRGVYAVGYRRVSAKGRWMAAVLACGPDAVLSHRTAIALWDLRPRTSGPVDVTIPGRSKRGRKGIRVHNVRALAAPDRTVIDGIPVTSLPRTLLDYAEVAHRQQLRLALEAAERRQRLDARAIEELLARSPGRRLIVEVDSWDFHRSRSAFEDDRRRDAKLQLAGWRVLRVTDWQMKETPARVIGAIRTMLSAAA